jgi:hypothetical protein
MDNKTCRLYNYLLTKEYLIVHFKSVAIKPLIFLENFAIKGQNIE